MDFTPTSAQQDLGGLVRDITTSVSTPQHAKDLDAAADRFDTALWTALTTAGIPSAALPEAAGGDGFGVLEQSTILAELGREVAVVPYLTSIVLGANAIAEFGTADQIAEYAEPAGRGALLLTAALDEDLDDGLPHPATTAEPTDAGWRVTGSKSLVPFVGAADVFLVPASTEGGVRVFLIRASDAGVSIEPASVTDHSPVGFLDLSGVEVASDRALGDESVAGWLRTRAAFGQSAYQAGVLDRALELTAAYANERVQFGKKIGQFQAVSGRLADAYIDVKGLRLTVLQAAWRLSEGLDAETEVATAKFWAADAGHRVAHTAVHIHGGVGLDTENMLHRYFIAAKQGEFTYGAATAQLRAIGSTLASTPA